MKYILCFCWSLIASSAFANPASSSVKIRVTDPRLSPLLKKNQIIEFDLNADRKAQLQRGDLVLLSQTHREKENIKKVYGMGGDRLTILSTRSFCSLELNGEPVRNSQGMRFVLAGKTCEYLREFTQKHDQRIPPNYILALGDQARGVYDLSLLATVNKEDVIGVQRSRPDIPSR